uniref:Ferredoxin n=1 Tax=Ascaris lumbricoides TaxID=6252 RepID=A0A0M3HVC7_ASCLU
MMGACVSCLRMMLDAESDVKIHVIEPTTVAAPEHSMGPQTRGPPAGPRLTVPSASTYKNNLHP